MKKNDKSVPEFSRDFKAICDQLTAMGRPVDDLDKLHCFKSGSHAGGHGEGRSSRGGRGRGGRNNRDRNRPIRCQICRGEGHMPHLVESVILGLLIYLLLYVDDIVVTSNNSILLNAFIDKLSKEFATKDMGSLSYFLGLEAHRTSSGLFLSQAKYAHEILQRAKLVDSKPVSTPMVVAHHLSTDGFDFDDPLLYRSLVGALQYLTITRLDLAHAVSTAIKRILRYIKGTLRYGLSFTPSSSCDIHAYSDADWAGCPDIQQSISGYAIYLGDNLFQETTDGVSFKL
ncbi:hypothetical protein F2P56_013604 [Juglans regia]|uniref:Reverse transcriptase Ty1/copia-type domain-containing protein n=1 Tax=Juglans regia TaxID=51240 RepID=A0A834CW10_JUGRE|nr:hypothetical protein F2P56_013604 [Juglans regia]